MPDDLSLLDQLEEWLEAQVPSNLQDLPFRMLETMERVSNEIIETLSIHGPTSISIPFPPFLVKEPPPPPPQKYIQVLQTKTHRLVKAHPYIVGAGAALALTMGLGTGFRMCRKGVLGLNFARRGASENGMLKEAIVVLSPSPIPAILCPMVISLLRAGYIVIIAVAEIEDAEMLEKRLAPLQEKSALRVLIYDPDEAKTFPAFERSLRATLTLRFPSSTPSTTQDMYNPLPTQIPHIHCYISLYPLNPTPPSQPSPLPALPTLLSPVGPTKRVPRLITLYPSSSVLVQPDAFASQVLTANHQLLGRNLKASYGARVSSIYLGHLNMPNLSSMLINARLTRFSSIESFRQASGAAAKLRVVLAHIGSRVQRGYGLIAGRLGLGGAARDYDNFEHSILRIIRRGHSRDYTLGQYSYLPLFLNRHLPVMALTKFLSTFPTLPSAVFPPMEGYTAATTKDSRIKSSNALSTSMSVDDLRRSRVDRVEKSYPGGKAGNSSNGTGTRTNSSSDAESEGVLSGEGDDTLTNSVHTSSGESAEDGLEGSWIGLDASG